MKTAQACGVLALWLVIPATAQAQRSDEFTFATTKLVNFEVKATTQWEASDGGPPFISSTTCRGGNEEIEFSVDGNGALALNLQFLGEPNASGERDYSASGDDLRWLYVDGERYQYRGLPLPSGYFLNFNYPPPQEPGEIILVARYRMAVRKSASEPFYAFSSIYETVARARKLRWGMIELGRDADSDKARALIGKTFTFDNRGLQEAVAWCRLQVVSTAAQTLPADVIDQLELRAQLHDIRSSRNP